MKQFVLSTLGTAFFGLLSGWSAINLPEMTSRAISNSVTLIAGTAMVVCSCYAFLQFALLLVPANRKNDQ